MYLLISTPLQIFLVDLLTKNIETIRTGDGYYYGITFKGNSIVLSHSMGVLKFYRSNNDVLKTDIHLIQPHQIEWVDDKILVANTGKNCISVYNEDGTLLKDVYLNDIHWDDKDKGRKGNHFNSVHRENNFIYIVAHNYDRSSEVYQLTWPDLELVNIYVTNASWAHNIWKSEYGLIICDSKHGSLYDVITKETIWQINKTPWMTRGLAVSKDYIFVGYSTYAERKDRYWKSGGVRIIDRKTLNSIEDFPILGSGDIQEIRLVGEKDYAHNNQILLLQDIDLIKRQSKIISYAYNLRNNYVGLQHDIFPFSQIVRLSQMIIRWRENWL